jgi:hypothetical protein
MNHRTEIIDGKPVKITICPPRVCAWGYSPHTPDHALGDTEAAEGPLDFNNGKLFKIKPKHRERGADRGKSAIQSAARMAAIDVAAEFAAALDKPAWVASKAAEMKKSVEAVKAMIKRGGGSIAGCGNRLIGAGISDEQKAAISGLRSGGMSIESIASSLTIGRSTVSRYVREMGMAKPAPNPDLMKGIASEWLDLPKMERKSLPAFAEARGVNYHALRSAIRRLSGEG